VIVTKPIRYQGKGHALGDPCGLDVPWRTQLRRDLCAYCGNPGGTLDHIVPRRGSRKQSGPLSNLTGACQRCNGEKGQTPLLLYLLERVNSGERVRA